MTIVTFQEAEAGFSALIEEIERGEFVTITRQGKPIAALVSLEAAEAARQVLEKRRSGLVSYLRSYPGEPVERFHSSSRDVDL
ncbi:type II toxin-antitoxin system Phd/YefM family antitoxin [Pararhodospirillum oryzae]|uniref:Antitoxin n=1 Tax=Pararhodospirillum oryzae TaxID=478448 RepID=A0A512H9D4_9PROT|nr:type II toxin-antitoxin system Phd/YefM family antitoxin [Pararhodospirillum oryzae]GEO82028.1 antitoxin [Pararhodospirillum oryzae]